MDIKDHSRRYTLLAFAGRMSPRYTSYPTAPHFHAGVTGKTYAGWLAALPAQRPVSLYVHVPYCHTLCWYCGCNTRATQKRAPVAAYVGPLLAEIDRVADALPARMKVSHLAFGGGTPTILSPRDLDAIMRRIRQRFDLASGGEISIEIDPRHFSADLAAALGAHGFTRASTGIQTFDLKVQKAINRVQSLEITALAFERLRAAGITGINADVLYGLPYQTLEASEQTALGVAGLKPSRLAVFGYAHVPHMKAHQKLIPDEALPGPEARLDQAERMDAILRAADYQRIGIDHYARPSDAMASAAREGRLRRNFQGYTTDTAETLIGVGASSISRTPSGYVQNIGSVRDWAKTVASGTLPVARGVAITPEDRVRGAIIEALMTRLEADPGAIAARFGAAPPKADLLDLERAGIVSRDGGTIRVSIDFRPLARLAAAPPFFGPNSMRFWAAVHQLLREHPDPRTRATLARDLPALPVGLTRKPTPEERLIELRHATVEALRARPAIERTRAEARSCRELACPAATSGAVSDDLRAAGEGGAARGRAAVRRGARPASRSRPSSDPGRLSARARRSSWRVHHLTVAAR